MGSESIAHWLDNRPLAGFTKTKTLTLTLTLHRIIAPGYYSKKPGKVRSQNNGFVVTPGTELGTSRAQKAAH